MESNEVLLKMENITKDFFGNKVLQGVDMTIKRGEILGLVGENGAGKSTLMNILFGLPVIQQTGGFEGKIIFDGNEVEFKSPFDAIDAGIGMVHQEFVLIPGFTATENILLNRESTKYNFLVDVFGDRLRSLDREDMRRRSLEAIKTLEVGLDENMLVSQMPVGHRQFTEIAREMDRKSTKLLVLDEPTAVLTESEAETMVNAAKKLAKKGLGIIFISHRLQEILDLCDRVVVLRDGHLVYEKPTNDTNPREIAEHMVGRDIEKGTKEAEKTRNFGETIFSVDNLWVDMPGEEVKGVSFKVKREKYSALEVLPDRENSALPMESWVYHRQVVKYLLRVNR